MKNLIIFIAVTQIVLPAMSIISPATAQPIVKRASREVCECINANPGKSIEERFSFFEDCRRTIYSKYKAEAERAIDSTKGSTMSAQHKAFVSKRNFLNEVERIMVDSCDAFFHLIDSATSKLFALEDIERGKKKLAAADSLVRKSKAPIYLSERAFAYAMLHDFPNAFKDLETILTMDSSYAGAYRMRGMIYQWMGNLEAAKVEFEKAISKRNDPSTELLLAIVNRKLQRR